jgi:hypothetical protein
MEFKKDENIFYDWHNTSDRHRPIWISKNKGYYSVLALQQSLSFP